MIVFFSNSITLNALFFVINILGLCLIAFLRNIRRRIFEIASQDNESDSVYRVNLHIFPISEKVPAMQLKVNQEKRDE